MNKRKIEQLEALANRIDGGGYQRPPPRRVQTVQDVLDLLEEQVDVIRNERRANGLERARVLVQLAAVARKVIEVGMLAQRVDMLEAELRQRKTAR